MLVGMYKGFGDRFCERDRSIGGGRISPSRLQHMVAVVLGSIKAFAGTGKAISLLIFTKEA